MIENSFDHNYRSKITVFHVKLNKEEDDIVLCLLGIPYEPNLNLC